MSPVASTYTVEDQRRMTAARNYFAWQAGMVKPELGARVVEAGCGIGNFTGALLDREAVIAVDIDPECVQLLKDRYRGQQNLQALTGDVSAPGFEQLARFRPDSCVCLNLLEHIEDDSGTLSRMASILVPGGIIVLLVPAFQSLYGPIDRNLGHYRRYGRGSLCKLAQTAGLEIKRLQYVNVPGFFGWWMNSRILKREAQSESQIECFDRYVLPWTSRLEAIVKPPFGQSIFAVLRKP